MKKLAKSTKWLIGVLIALMMLLASFGIVCAVNSGGSKQNNLTASGASGGVVRCYIFVNKVEAMLKRDGGIIDSFTTDREEYASDPSSSWEWSDVVSKSGQGVDEHGNLTTFGALGLPTPSGSYQRNYNTFSGKIIYTVTIGTKKYVKEFEHNQGYGEILNFMETDRKDVGYNPPKTQIPSSLDPFAGLSGLSSEATYTGSNLYTLPSACSYFMDLTIQRLDGGTLTTVYGVVDVGTYMLTVTAKSGYEFAGGQATKQAIITVKQREVTGKLQVNDESPVYDGTPKKGYTVSGDTSYFKINTETATEAGPHTATLALANSKNLKWKDNSNKQLNPYENQGRR